MIIKQEDINKVASTENVDLNELTLNLKNYETIIVSSRRGIEPLGIGKGLSSKFACIVGSSSLRPDIDEVIKKAKIAEAKGASVIHNGSSGGNITEIRHRLLESIRVPLASCHPIGIMAEAVQRKLAFVELRESEFIESFRRDAESGYEILLLPLGINRKLLEKLKSGNRLIPCPSKSGALMTSWMIHTGLENPYITHFDDILKIAKENNITLSVVASYRSGCINDALDNIQYYELDVIKECVQRAISEGVQVKTGSGGHIQADKIMEFIHYQKKLFGVPIICFGPQVTDISIGYDHISAAMGQLIALLAGANIIFSVTASEHISMPDTDAIKQGCIISRIVCHSADICRGRDIKDDFEISKARAAFDWEKQSKSALDESIQYKLLRCKGENLCDMCGDFCAYKIMNSYIKNT